MSRTISTLVACMVATSMTGCLLETEEEAGTIAQPLVASSAADRAALALHWAPVHYQDVDPTGSHALGGAADYIARYDYDGDLNARNNWDNAGNSRFPLAAHAYYSVVETSSHWFIVYMFFHPRDWTDSFFDTEHENDSEGLLATVARDGSAYGSLKSLVTVAHTDFYSFLPPGSDWGSGGESVDGAVQTLSDANGVHPITAQQAKGHGLKARPYYDIDGEGVVYTPSLGTSEVPASPNDREVAYRLVDIFTAGGLWDNRDNAQLFAGFGSFAGDKTGGCGKGAISCGTNSANAPWGWDDGNDGPARGALATDPAGLVKAYFKIPEAVSATYTFNPYR